MKPHRPAAVFLASLAALLSVAAAALGSAGSISSISPDSGPTAGGTAVRIEGFSIYPGGSTPEPEVTIGGQAATVVSSGFVQGTTKQVTVITPAGAAGPADVVVKQFGQEWSRSNGGFTYVAPPRPISVTGVSPASGLTTGGEQVSITGTGFSAGALPVVAFGGVPATGVTVVNDTTLSAVTPERAPGSVDVTVSRGTEQASRASAYEYRRGWWLTVSNIQPPGFGPSSPDSFGAVRTPGLGDWRTVTKEVKPFTVLGLPSDMLNFNVWTYSDFAGGINCGNRTVGLNTGGLGTAERRYMSGPCRYAFADGATVRLSAPGSLIVRGSGETAAFTVGTPYLWGGACAGTGPGQCSVQMRGDRSASMAWVGLTVFLDDAALAGDVAVGYLPTFDRSGQLVFFRVETKGRFNRKRYSDMAMAAWTVGYLSAGRRQQAAAGRQRLCTARVRSVGGRLVAGCRVSPALARALRRGPVRVSTRWYVKPRTTRAVMVASGRPVVVRNRPGAPPVAG